MRGYTPAVRSAESEIDAELSIKNMFKCLRQHLSLFLLIVGLCGCLGLGASFALYKPYYTAEATFTLTGNNDADSFYGASVAQQFAKTFGEVFTGDYFLNIVKEDVGVEKLNASVEVEFIENTNMFKFKVNSADPQNAYDVLSSVIASYPKITRYVIPNLRLNSIIEASVSDEPANSAQYPKYILLGVLAGVLVSLCAAFVMGMRQSPIQRPEDIGTKLNAPLAGRIKNETVPRGRECPLISASSSVEFKENLNYISNSVIRKMQENHYKTLIVTATSQYEGSTTAALNLAVVTASKGLKVLLIDADMRAPSVARFCEIRNPRFVLNDILEGGCEFSDAINAVDENLDVICAGVTKYAGNMVACDRMKQLVSELKDEYDIIIIDTPPCEAVSDAKALAIEADCLLYVVGKNGVSLNRTLDALNSFNNSPIEFLGCVFNEAR